MIDHFSIFTKGGLVLWSYTQAKLRGSPIDNLIRDVIVEERSGETSYNLDQYTLKWSMANEVDLILVVVYQKILSLLYIDELLEAVKRKFIETFGDAIKNTSREFEFTDAFVQLLDNIESRAAREREKHRARGPKSFYETQKGKQLQKDKPVNNKPEKKKQLQNSETQDNQEEDEQDSDDSNAIENESAPPSQDTTQDDNSLNASTDSVDSEANLDPEERIRRNIEKMKQKKNNTKSKPTKVSSPSPKPKRGDRKWDDQISNKDKAALDYSKKITSDVNVEKVDVMSTKMDLDQWDNKDEDEAEKPQQTATGKIFSFFQTISGNKPLDTTDLEPVMAKFKEHLISKNVASDIAEKLCGSVSVSLQGKKLGTFGSIRSTFKDALEEALVRILTPKKSIDILRDAQMAKERGRPYTIVFCGVNGVGKSTNLAKICAFFMQNNFTPLVAAGDTFRAGAVEQLNVHCKRLGVELYERGYRTDPTSIAIDAIRQAKLTQKDVVLIDTAGRMQDNVLLMQALSKLVNTVKPDLVLFVGEALVGHDAVDQLVKFNQNLIDMSKEKDPRTIDGIVLTKFDTIDDKVGAAISMVYTTGQPIVFVGVGQHYTDLKRLNVTAVTKALLKGC